MKKMMLVCIIGLISELAHAQKLEDSQVPLAVKQSFAKSFPNAKTVTWSTKDADEYEAEFMTGKLKQAADFDSAGKWLMTETGINYTDLSREAKAAIKREFGDYRIDDLEQSTSADTGMLYEVTLLKAETKYEVQLSSSGKVLKMEEVTK